MENKSIIIDETVTYTLQEICILCNADNTTIVEFIEYGIIEPDVAQQDLTQFSYRQLRRTQLALKLIRDLEVELNGLGFSLDLLEEVQDLRQEVKTLDQLLRYYRGE